MTGGHAVFMWGRPMVFRDSWGAGESWDGEPVTDPVAALRDAIERTDFQPAPILLSQWELRRAAVMLVNGSLLPYRVKQTFRELVRFGETRGRSPMPLREMIERATAAEPDPKAARKALSKRLAPFIGDEEDQ